MKKALTVIVVALLIVAAYYVGANYRVSIGTSLTVQPR